MHILVMCNPNYGGEQSCVEEQSMTNDTTEKSNQMLLLDEPVSLSNDIKQEMRNSSLREQQKWRSRTLTTVGRCGV